VNTNLPFRKIIVISLVVFVVFIGGIVVALLTTQNKANENNQSTTYSDAITGDQIVDVPNKTPEKIDEEEVTVPVLGGNNIAGYFGDDAAYNAFINIYLQGQFAEKEVVKIAKDNISRNTSIDANGDATTTINCRVYIDSETTKFYTVRIEILQTTREIRVTAVSPSNITTTETIPFSF